MFERKRIRNDLQNITQKTRDWAAWTALKTVVNSDAGRVSSSYPTSGRVGSSYSTSDTHRVTVKRHKHDVMWTSWWTPVSMNEICISYKSDGGKWSFEHHCYVEIVANNTTRNLRHKDMWGDIINNTNPIWQVEYQGDMVCFGRVIRYCFTCGTHCVALVAYPVLCHQCGMDSITTHVFCNGYQNHSGDRKPFKVMIST